VTEGPVPEEPRPGSMRFQDGTTPPREPTLAEQKAREQAERRRAEEARRETEEAERKQRIRRRIMNGAGVTVGLAAVIGIGYLITSGDEETAYCTDEDGVIVDDSNCVTPVASSSGPSGAYPYPIFIGAGGRQYHYTYGGSGTLGERVKGGTTTLPSDKTKVKTYTSGRTISGGRSSSGDGPSLGSSSGSTSVRGGLGAKSSSGSSKSGGSSSKSSGS
jgi:hypothetical protein